MSGHRLRQHLRHEPTRRLLVPLHSTKLASSVARLAGRHAWRRDFVRFWRTFVHRAELYLWRKSMSIFFSRLELCYFIMELSVFKVLSRKILKYWSNFVRYSNPNGPFQESTSSYETMEDSIHGMRRFNDLEQYVRPPNRASQTMMQPIEYWPKYRIVNNPNDDAQRAFIVLSSYGVTIDYNLRAEYCAFWGSFIPSLVLSECKTL